MLAVGAIAVIFIASGSMSYQDAVDAHSIYCEQVFGDNPVYPDYNEIGEDACEGSLQKWVTTETTTLTKKVKKK